MSAIHSKPSTRSQAEAQGLTALRRAEASAASDHLSPSEIGDKLLTDYWNVREPRSFDAKAGDTLTYDVSALTDAGRTLARAALDEWSEVTGLRFKEVTGGFRPEAVHEEGGDAAASIATQARARLGEALDGRLGAGDRDWVRLDLSSGQVARITVEGRGRDALETPGLALFDALGRPFNIGVQHSGSSAEVTVSATGAGGTYYAQVTGHGGAEGSYRLSLAEPGGRGGADIAFDDDRAGANAELNLAGSEIVSADVNVSTRWLSENGKSLTSYSFQTYLHEIGHALGLGHPGDYNDRADFDEAEFANDSWQTSVMSYFNQRENPHVDADKAYAVTPMIGDVMAAWTLYGKPSVRAGNTTYGEDSDTGGMLDRVEGHRSALAFTIVDTGGLDRIALTSQRADQRLDLREGAASDVFGHEGNMVIAPGSVIENASLGWGDDRVIGNAADNRIWGNGGDDRIEGGSGRDDLYGGDGDDRLRGDAGDDKLRGRDDDDDLRGGSGDDDLSGGEGEDRLRGDSGEDRLRGEAGRDRLWGGKGDDMLSGGDGSDRLRGGSGDDRLYGGGGHDDLRGGGGADRISASGGRDEVRGGSGRDDLRGGGGEDVLRGEGSGDALRGGSSDDRLYGQAGRDDLRGGSGDDRIEGGSGSDQMRGGRGDDVMSGGSGADRIKGQAGADEMRGGKGSDEMFGGSGADRIKANSGSDLAKGGSDRDRLDGGKGRDVLDGGSGNDRLTGGGGDDTFVFRGTFGRDRVMDFEPGDDRIDLSRVGAIRSWDDLRDDHLRERGDDVMIRAGDAGKIVLKDVSLDALDAHDFLL